MGAWILFHAFLLRRDGFMEQKLYYYDSYKIDFIANIISKKVVDNKNIIVLDGTYFYPTSGGQPCDTGTINGAKVLEVYEKDGVIYHVVEGCTDGLNVHCKIDWEKRFDHMQQHSGQHLLSYVFDKMYRAETESFSIGSDFSHITVGKDGLTVDEALKVEIKVNELIYKNIPIKTYIVDENDLLKLPLRKRPKVKNNVRIVEIEGIDYSPCGGTHVKSTGEIGIIKIRKWEKAKGGVRIEFVCGFRAFYDYSFKNDYINRICNIFSVKDIDTLQSIEKLIQENKILKKELSGLKEHILLYEAKELIYKSEVYGGIHVIYEIFENRDFNDVKNLAQHVVESENCVVIFGNKTDIANIVISRSDNIDIKINEFFKDILLIMNGRGGGSSKTCQGGGSIDKLETAMDRALNIIIDKINKL